MKLMKKPVLISFVMLLAFSIFLAGCGGGSSTQPAASKEEVPADIKAIKDRGVFKAGVKVDVPKFGYKDPKTGNVEGFEIDLVKALAK